MKPEEFAEKLNEFLHPLATSTLIKGSSPKKDSGEKTLVLPLPSMEDYSIELKADLDLFQLLIQRLQAFLPSNKSNSALNWHDSVHDFINTYLSAKGETIDSATRASKKELILKLNQKGFFSYQQASAYLAKYLQLSRASIYNYLNEASSMTTVQVHQVDSFTDKKFSGNPAGVVLGAEHLSDSLMKKITRELNVNETAFVMEDRDADFAMRYFTPSGDEVCFCGHSSIAALYMIADQEKFNSPTHLKIKTKAGNLDMWVKINKGKNIEATYQAPFIDLKVWKKPLPCKSLNYTKAPVYFEKTSKDLFIRMPNLEALRSLSPDLKLLEAYGKKLSVVVFCFYTNETIEKKNTLHCRCFAPAVGISEDPSTGSVQGGLVAVAHKENIIDQMSGIIVEQGDFIKRPGRVEVNLVKEGEQYHAKVTGKVTGKAVHCYSTQMEI